MIQYFVIQQLAHSNYTYAKYLIVNYTLFALILTKQALLQTKARNAEKAKENYDAEKEKKEKKNKKKAFATQVPFLYSSGSASALASSSLSSSLQSLSSSSSSCHLFSAIENRWHDDDDEDDDCNDASGSSNSGQRGSTVHVDGCLYLLNVITK